MKTGMGKTKRRKEGRKNESKVVFKTGKDSSEKEGSW
jgi:hypothetical protein